MKSFNKAAFATAMLAYASASSAATDSRLNPALSIILDGGYASYDNNPEDYTLSGFALGGESELQTAGFSVGHSEITASANIDSQFYGQFTFALAEHEGVLNTELEEAFIQTTSLGDGLRIRAGRFLSSISYMNVQHEHAWDFRDAPLIYRGLFGKNYIDDGLQLTWVAPTDLFIESGVELLAGNGYPAGGEHPNVGASTVFFNFGGDISDSSSWLAGVSHWSADKVEREYGGHDHGGTGETPVFAGDSTIDALYAVYKWSPYGNVTQSRFKLQFEMFSREDEGDITLLNSGPPIETSTLMSEQDGWYLQAIYGWSPTWNAGIRYDALDSDNQGNDAATLDEAGLLDNGHDPSRTSMMVEWVPSEFSRVRLQFNRDDSSAVSDNQLFLQYTFSVGAHGAHSY